MSLTHPTSEFAPSIAPVSPGEPSTRRGTLRRLAGLTGACITFGSLAQACEVRTEPPKANPVRVVTTIGMIADVASTIGGDRAHVTALMGEGVDPHLYKASPGDLRQLSSADLVLYNGLHLEGRLADALVKLSRRTTVIQITEPIPETDLREPPEFAGHFDPHVWFDVELWTRTIPPIRDALIKKDSAGRAGYEARAAAYESRLRDLHAWVKTQIATIPVERRILVTAHDAFGYFGRAYGIEVRAIQGISTEGEASLRDIGELVDLLVAQRVPAVFVESSVPRKTIDALVEGCRAKGHELVIGGELFSDAMGMAGTFEGTYIGMVHHNVRTIVNALGGRFTEPTWIDQVRREGTAATHASPASRPAQPEPRDPR